MSKKLFIILVVLMSLSLIGIISIQAYYIKNSVDNERDQFNFNVKYALSDATKSIEDREFRDYVYKLKGLIGDGVQVDYFSY